jgi:F-type H+-transporting ATPase subunit delta
MKISKHERRDAKELFRSCVAGGLLNEDRVRQATTKVLEVKPRGYLGILAHFLRLVKLDLERRAARVESAVALAPELQTTVRNNLAKAYGQGLNISFSQNAALIGGLRIKVGSDVFDGSVQGRLRALEDSFELT